MSNQDHHWWYQRGQDYLDMAHSFIEDGRPDAALSSLQHAAEFFFKAIIRYHSGDHPHIRNPYTLMHICRLYLPEVDHVFPRKTRSEIKLFSLLNPYRFTSESCTINLETIHQLLRHVEELKQLVVQLQKQNSGL